MRLPGLFKQLSFRAVIRSPSLILPGATKKQGAGSGAAAPGLVFLASGTVSSAATLDIVLTAYTAYRGLKFVLSGFLPATDDVELWMRLSTDGGSTYDAGASNYDWGWAGGNTSPLTQFRGSTGDTKILIAGDAAALEGVGNASAEGVNAEITLLNQASAAFWPRITHQGAWVDAAATPLNWFIQGGGMRRAAQDTDAVRFLFETGNISAGNYAVYGLA